MSSSGLDESTVESVPSWGRSITKVSIGFEYKDDGRARLAKRERNDNDVTRIDVTDRLAVPCSMRPTDSNRNGTPRGGAGLAAAAVGVERRQCPRAVRSDWTCPHTTAVGCRSVSSTLWPPPPHRRCHRSRFAASVDTAAAVVLETARSPGVATPSTASRRLGVSAVCSATLGKAAALADRYRRSTWLTGLNVIGRPRLSDRRRQLFHFGGGGGDDDDDENDSIPDLTWKRTKYVTRKSNESSTDHWFLSLLSILNGMLNGGWSGKDRRQQESVRAGGCHWASAILGPTLHQEKKTRNRCEEFIPCTSDRRHSLNMELNDTFPPIDSEKKRNKSAANYVPIYRTISAR